MVALSCQICLGHFSCSQFKLFICGHGYCKSCVDTLFSQDPRFIRCPCCRKPIRKLDIYPVFLEFVEAKTTFTNTVSEGFAKMDVDTPLDSVKRAAEKIEKGAKISRGSTDLTTQLLQSIEDFKRRIIPIFEKVQSQRQEIQSLQSRIFTHTQSQLALQSQLLDLEPLPREITRLKQRLDTATRLADEATLAAEGIKNEMIALRNDRDGYRKIAADLDAEKRRVSDQVERNALQARTSREKYKAAKNELTQLKEKHRRVAEQNNFLTSPLNRPEGGVTFTSTNAGRSSHKGFHDGDCSSHEPTQMTPSRAYHNVSQKDDCTFDLHDLPKKGFGSDWQLQANRGYGLLTKGRPAVAHPTHRRVANPMFSGPLKLDRKGQPTTAVQLGPKRSCKGF